MKLKFKKIQIDSGRPIAFLNKNSARALNIHKDERAEVSYKGKKIVLAINILDEILSSKEISLSSEALSYLKIKEGEFLEIEPSVEPQSISFIFKKLNGKRLKREEIDSIIKDIVSNSLNEAEIAYFVSAVFEHGMSYEETIALTEAIAKSGNVIKWNSKTVADKHSIGGIPNNRTTPIVVSICAAAGIIIPKTSSKAITTASATADAMETITNVYLSTNKLKSIVAKTNACLAWGGSLGLAPADDKLIRVERLLKIDPEAQLIASIIAKKIAVGSTDILIDIPYGNGAKVSFEKAKKLKNKFSKIGAHFGKKIEVVLTDGSQPIGNGVGPVLEIVDVLAVLNRKKSPKDLEEKALFLASKILEMTNNCKRGEGYSKAKKILDSKEALKKFNEIIELQGKKSIVLKPAKFSYSYIADEKLKIVSIDNQLINSLGRTLGCPTDFSAGMYLHKHVGETVFEKQPLITLYAQNRKKLKEGIKFFSKTKPIKTITFKK